MASSLEMAGALSLACSSVITGALVAFALAPEGRAVRWLVAFGLWLTAMIVLGFSGFFDGPTALGTFGVGGAVLVPVILFVSLFVMSADLRERIMTLPPALLIGVHTTRVFGVLFLILHAGGQLRGPFGPVAGWGDVMIGLLALPVAWLVHHQARGSLGLAAAFTLLGTLDLIAAVSLGVMSAPDSPVQVFTQQTEAVMNQHPWLLIPTFLVPVYLIAHVAMFAKLMRHIRQVSAPPATT